MKPQHRQPAAAAAVLVVIGLLAAGVSVSTVLLLAIFLVGPLMMTFMHGGHGGHCGRGHDGSHHAGRDDASTPGRRPTARDEHHHH